MDFERMEAAHVVELSRASDEVSEMFEEALAVLEEQGANYLSKLSETMLMMQKKLSFAFKAQGRQLKKVERSEAAVSTALAETKENVNKRVSKMVEEITKR